MDPRPPTTRITPPPADPRAEVAVRDEDTTVVNVGPPPRRPIDGRPPRAPWPLIALVVALLIIGLIWWFMAQSQQQASASAAATATATAATQATAAAQEATAAAQAAVANQQAANQQATATQAAAQANAAAQAATVAAATATTQAVAATEARAAQATTIAQATAAAPTPVPPPPATPVVIVVTAIPAPAPPAAPAGAAAPAPRPPAPAPPVIVPPAPQPAQPSGSSDQQSSQADETSAAPAASPAAGGFFATPASVTVVAGQPTQLRYLGERVTLSADPDALPAGLTLTLRPVEAGTVPQPPGPIVDAIIFRLEARAADGSALPAPIPVRVRYAAGTVPPAERNRITLGALDGQTWKPLPNQSGAPAAGLVTAELPRAGVYALYRQP
jgi:hypothetical protein